MKISPNKLIMSLGIFFLITGIIWISLAIIHEGTMLLVELGMVNLITGALLITKFWRRYIRALIIASSIYSLIVCSYQFYAASSLLQLGLTTFTIISLIVYGLSSLAFLFIVIISYINAQAFISSTVGQ
ncbi:MAG: hypothetical protein H3Z52_10025, partial [archaeon]|nr:hypothetical protein [archaeon]